MEDLFNVFGKSLQAMHNLKQFMLEHAKNFSGHYLKYEIV